MYRDDVSIYNGASTTNQFTDNTQLNNNTVYEYSVVAISCAGNSTAGVKSISIESEYLILSLMSNQYLTNCLVPSSPVVTISQPNSNCYNTLISWSISDADIEYRVYRNSMLIYNESNNDIIDNTQLNINTVYEYSVVAISCVGTSTAGVKSISIESELYLSQNYIYKILLIYSQTCQYI